MTPAAAADTRRPPVPHGTARRSAFRLTVVYALVFLISLADALTPAGVVVGLLLGIPIVIASLSPARSDVLAAGLTSLLCFVLAAILGAGPLSPQVIWLPNRVLAMLGLVAMTWIALVLQQRRRQLEAEHAAAEGARDLSRLLHSLLAHDLRTPLILARQSFDMVRTAAAAATTPSLPLIDEVDARLARSLRTIERVLDAARADLDDAGASSLVPLSVARALDEELATFRADAAAADKTLVLEVAPADLVLRLNAPVLRQAVAILVDNAIRYAKPGTITVRVQRHGAVVWVHVRDPGPGPAATRASGGQSAGIGLRLGRLLAERAGGSVETARSGADGTEFVLRLPALPV